jgi:UrcA family protein
MTTRIIQRTLLAFVLAGSLIATAAPTRAEVAAKRRSLDMSITVRFADLNLNTREGARIAYGRIQGAAEKVCGPRLSVWDGRRARSWKRCYRATVDDVIARIDVPTLTARHHLGLAYATRDSGARLTSELRAAPAATP